MTTDNQWMPSYLQGLTTDETTYSIHSNELTEQSIQSGENRDTINPRIDRIDPTQ